VVTSSTHLIDYANRVIDTETLERPANRVTNELTEINDRLAVVESFSHSWAVKTAEGLVVFDASGKHTGAKVVAALREWTNDPVHTIVYTHGHIDHVGGAGTFVEDAETRGHRRPQFVGHQNVRPRLDRYETTNGYNVAINQRQFAPGRKVGMNIGEAKDRFVPDQTPRPDVEFDEAHTLKVGDDTFVLRHDRGETDDHAWTEWVGHDTLFVGDFLIWNFPNCGNPQKVLRYPAEWAAAMRKMAATNPAFVAPAHGLPVVDPKRTQKVLGTVADALESLVSQVLELLNADARLEDAIHTVKVPDDLLALPWLRPMYDEPEFVVRNIWRTYGGWWDGNPAHLHTPHPSALAEQVVALAGGTDAVVARAESIAASDMRTACELIEFAARVAPDDVRVHTARADLYSRRRFQALSLMAKGIYLATALESAEVAGVEVPANPLKPPLS
jgi:glyoxylase-like metal-dependent hydrolase (beta-lactamase superfamily II)